MIKDEFKKSNEISNSSTEPILSNQTETVCNLSYLYETMGGKKHLIKEIIDAFLEQVLGELQAINDAISKTDYSTIKNVAHTMKSTLSIAGISEMTSVLQQMEELGTTRTDITTINELNLKLRLTCFKAIEELEKAKKEIIENQ